MKKIWNKIRNIVCKKQMVDEKNEATTTVDAEQLPKQLDAWCESGADGENRACLLLISRDDGKTTYADGIIKGNKKQLTLTIAQSIEENREMHELLNRAMMLAAIKKITHLK